MAWYDDKHRRLHIATYKNAKRAEAEGREAAAKGWTVRETREAAERVAVGRALARGIATAGIGLLRGRPRKGGTVTVRYERVGGDA